MCGITGFAQVAPTLGRDDLERMTATLLRRGPDEAGFYCDDRVGLGMRRLSIIDLSGGQQPLRSGSGRYIAVFNGEIYNYQELQQQLSGAGVRFRSNGDGEVAINLYEKYGPDAFNMLRGMFTFAIWDTRERELLLVRDQLGIKPLFYLARDGSLLFGSEMKSMLAVLPGRMPVSAQAVDALFAYTYIPAPLTIWQDVRKLEPAHYLRWRDGRSSIHRYWDLLDAGESPELTVPELRDALDSSIRAHLVSDVEVGAFLSGGLDSSTIVARMQGQMKSKIRAFSIRFADAGHLVDETRFAAELRDQCGFDLQIATLQLPEDDGITDAIRAFDEPFADDSILPNHAICALAARELKVVLSGAGGDEFFGGYNRYQGMVAHGQLGGLPRWLRSGLLGPGLALAATMWGAGSRRGDLISRFARTLKLGSDDAYLSYVTAAGPAIRNSLVPPEIARLIDHAATRSLVAKHLGRAARLAPLKRAMYADVATYLPEDILAISDRIGMFHSLEVRTPLADRVLAEAAFRIPPDGLVTLRSKKVALRRAVAPWLPASILSQPKQGFEAPTASWLRGRGAEVLRAALLHHRSGGVELVRPEAIEGLLQQHQSNRADNAKVLFSALSVMIWESLNRDRISAVV